MTGNGGCCCSQAGSSFFSLWLIKANTSQFPVSGEKESAESEAVGVSHMIKSKMIEQVLFFEVRLRNKKTSF